ncbi:MAG: MFS transporter [Deltaproteobacteria bacterium]|nr:MFS transporter [Deltaproteobacteria bacterium]
MADGARRFYWGWYVVLGAFLIMGVNYGTRYCFGIFVKPMALEYGWSRSVISAGMSVLLLAYGIGGVFGGRLIDRIAPRWLITVGAAFLAAGMLLTPMIREPWQFYLTYGICGGLGSGFLGVVVCNSSVAKWFVHQRGLAIGIASIGVGVGTMVLAPLAGTIVKVYDWRVGFICMGGLVLIIGVALSQWLMGRTKPEDYGLLPDGAAGSAPAAEHEPAMAGPAPVQRPLGTILVDSRFVVLAICYSLGFFAEMSAMVHQVPYALDRQIDKVAAASSLGMIGIASIFGRFFFGWLSDRVRDAKIVSSFGFLCMAVGMVLLLYASSTTILFVYALAFGFGYGALSTMIPYLLADRFGRHSLGAAYGMVTFCICVAGAIGPVVTGYIYDRSGSYISAWLVNLAALVVATFLILAMKPGDGQGEH